MLDLETLDDLFGFSSPSSIDSLATLDRDVLDDLEALLTSGVFCSSASALALLDLESRLVGGSSQSTEARLDLEVLFATNTTIVLRKEIHSLYHSL